MTPTELRKAYRIARSIATSLYRPRRSGSFEIEDLQQVGVLHLWRRRDRPRPDGVSWSSWAGSTIRYGMLETLRYLDHEEMATKARPHRFQAEAAREALRHRLLREPTEAEVAQELGLDLDEHLRMLQLRIQVSLASEITAEEGAAFDPADTRNTPEQDYEELETARALRRAVAELPKLQRIVVEDVLYRGRDKKDCAADLKVSDSSVSQALRLATKNLNERMKEHA